MDFDIEEILLNANKYGMPTFEEFKRNRDKFIGRDDDVLAQADVGSTILNRQVKKHIYELEGYRCKSLEEVESLANKMGINLKELDYRPIVDVAGAGKYNIIIRFVSKSRRDKVNETIKG